MKGPVVRVCDEVGLSDCICSFLLEVEMMVITLWLPTEVIFEHTVSSLSRGVMLARNDLVCRDRQRAIHHGGGFWSSLYTPVLSSFARGG